MRKFSRRFFALLHRHNLKWQLNDACLRKLFAAVALAASIAPGAPCAAHPPGLGGRLSEVCQCANSLAALRVAASPPPEMAGSMTTWLRTLFAARGADRFDRPGAARCRPPGLGAAL